MGPPPGNRTYPSETPPPCPPGSGAPSTRARTQGALGQPSEFPTWNRRARRFKRDADRNMMIRDASSGAREPESLATIACRGSPKERLNYVIISPILGLAVQVYRTVQDDVKEE